MSAIRKIKPGLPNSAPRLTTVRDWKQNLGYTTMPLCEIRRSDWWTGFTPLETPGLGPDGRLHSLKIPNLNNCTRQQVLDYFNNSWTLTELLFSSLISEEAFFRPPYHALRHPMIFYYVHPAVLYINKLRLAGLSSSPVNTYFEKLFETGVDEMSWDDMSKNDLKWPTVDQTWQYRREAYNRICDIIKTHPGLAPNHSPITQSDPLWALFMGFEHERIHLETSSVLIRELPKHLVSRPKQWPDDAGTARAPATQAPKAGTDYPVNNLLRVAAREVVFGKERDWPSFGWDNEYGSRVIKESEFIASQFLVSNGEFYEFINAGGYDKQQFWTEDGWAWRSFREAKQPTFWVCTKSKSDTAAFKLRTIFEEIPMEWSWPAIVNFHEAKAFCKWKSQTESANYRLITESEHQSLRRENGFDCTNKKVLSLDFPYNINLRFGSESSVDSPEQNNNKFRDLFGNAWQWCEDTFNPLDGTIMHPYYMDFSSPCYDNQHQMILGGSFISTGDEATPYARFHFRPHFFQHAGFRLVID